MSIIRGRRPEANWYALDKKISEDQRLSWAARGLLVFLLGKPDDWKVSIEHLRKQTAGARISTGRDGVYALLKELEAAGYLRVVQGRSANGRGFGDVDYIVSETVLPAEPDAANVLPAHADTPHADTAETTLVKTEKATRTEENQLQGGALPRTLEDALDWPGNFDLDRELVEDFQRHRQELGNPLTSSAWKHVLALLGELQGKGIDLNEALSVAMAMGYAMPVNPTRGKAAKIARRREAQQQLVDQDVRWASRGSGAWNAH